MTNSRGDSGYQTKSVNPLDALLDPENPRLWRDERGLSQNRLIEVMLERFKIEELADSILASGFIGFDPIVGHEVDGSITVIEGNRRLTVLKLLLNPELAPESQREHWSELRNKLDNGDLKSIEKIQIEVFENSSSTEVKSYIGFRHVTGVLQWPPLEKGAYIADLVERDQWTYAEIARRLGSYPKHIERHYVAHQIVRQSIDLEVPGSGQMRKAFGVLMRALQAHGISEFLGITYTGDPATSAVPIPKDKISAFEGFTKWTFGTDEQMSVIKDSRQLTQWGKILSSEEAVSYLRRTERPSFERAWQKSGGQLESIVDILYQAADRLQEAVPLVSEYKDEVEVGGAVKECTRYLAQILKHFPEIASRYGFSSDATD